MSIEIQGVAPAAVSGTARKTEAREPFRLRKLVAIDERPAAVAFVTTLRGQVVLSVVFGVLLASAIPVRIAVVALLAAVAVAHLQPPRREYALLGGTLACLFLDPIWLGNDEYQQFLEQALGGSAISARTLQRVLTFAFLAVVATIFVWAAKRPKSVLARHPVVCLLTLLTLSTLGGLYVLEPGLSQVWLIAAIKIVAAYMWFVCYGIVDQRAAKHPPVAFSLGTLRGFWSSFSPPIGKGAAFLARVRCRTPEELAVSQLKGLKLLVWSFAMFAISHGLKDAMAAFGIADLKAQLASAEHASFSPHTHGWTALAVATAAAALELAGWSHRAVACLRFAGFRLPRNTCRPLASRTIAEFWNRYYYYFKEMLVDFFFYPTFFRCFKKHPRLRVFFATFMAAGVGNAIFHFFRQLDLLFTTGVREATVGFTSYIVYCVILAGAIGVSQARTGVAAAAAQPATLVDRVKSFVCVWGLVALLHPFGGEEERIYSFHARLSFLAHHFGLI
ncbi:MAG TPA: hypothetical protein VJR89_13140 [Polyangiales bacterium]|nr:hypothetical protein [Polyangiales bacterium]